MRVLTATSRLLAIIPLVCPGFSVAASDKTKTSTAKTDVNGAPRPGLEGLSSNESSEAAHRRRIFYLGGDYVPGPANTTVFIDSVYTEQLIPADGVKQKNPIIFFHGGGFSGITWLQTPDNRKGFASYFLDKGYAVYLVDASATGRSTRRADEPASDPLAAENAATGFSVPEKLNAYPQAALHTQWPGTGERGDPVFDAWLPQAISVPLDFARTERAMAKAMCDLLARIGPSFLVGHSYGGLFPWSISNRCNEGVQGIFGYEFDTSPFYSLLYTPAKETRAYGLSNIPLAYDPPITNSSDLQRDQQGNSTPYRKACTLQKEPARKLVNLTSIPINLVVGEASMHATYDHCCVQYLRQAGVNATFSYLSDLGIRGNGHFGFIEKNNLDIAKVAYDWFQEHAGPDGRKKLQDQSSVNGTEAAIVAANKRFTANYTVGK